MRLGILTSHPIQYQAPWFRALAKEIDLEVLFAHRPNAIEQGDGFGTPFSWDIDLLSGYQHRFLANVARRQGTGHFSGCDTPAIRDIIRGGHYDAFIVTGWYLKCYWQAVRACRRARVPVLVRGDSQLQTPRSLLKRWLKAGAYRLALRQFDGFLTVGKRNREYLEHYGVPANRLFFAPHFVDSNWFAARGNEARRNRGNLRASWGADEETLVALFVGKFTPKKRPQDLLEALGSLRDSKERAVAVFVGSGELEGALRKTASNLKLTPHFEGFKNQTELPAYYAATDVLVLPSDGGETWGLVVNEAMACGLPAVVSQAAGCASDLVDEGRTGFTYPVGDVVQLANGISRIGKLRAAGYDFASALREKLASYSVEQAVEGTLEAVEAVSKCHAPRRIRTGAPPAIDSRC